MLAISDKLAWHMIDLLRNASLGDIIAWRTPEVVVGQDTGRVLFVAETPALLDDDSGNFAMRVYDSADVPHLEE